MEHSERNPRKKRGKIARFLSYYKPHLPLFITDMVCATLIAGVDILFPMASRHAMYQLLPNGEYNSFFWLMGILVLAYIIRSVMQYVVTYFGHVLGVRMEADMRRDLFSHMQTLSFSFYDKSRTGQLISRVVGDLFEISELAHHGPEDVFISALTLIGSFAFMISLSWKLSLVLLIVIPVLLVFTLRQRVRMAKASKEVKKKLAVINADIESSISGIRVAQAFANEQHEIEKFNEGNSKFEASKSVYYKVMAEYQAGMEFITRILNVIVIAVGGALIMAGDMDIATLITFLLFVSEFLQPIRRITAFMEQYSSGMAGFERMLELLDTPSDIADAPDAKPLENVKGEIRFNDVTFAYDDGVTVLSHVNLTIKHGEKLALVGPSGGGKSTLCQLIPRFYEPVSGSITIDGRDIRKVTLSSLRANIGMVQQDVFLFAGTIKDNIRYGKLNATDEEIVQAAKNAEIHDFIMTLPKGYDTFVGERGIMLSGGQKQRISIARIFLRNPPILILDEATSALDTETEVKIQNALDRLSSGRTTLVIAHRLSTVKNADEIIVIGDEGIAERGTHAELLEKDGAYAALYKAQFAMHE
ncbi:MAG: ABC transporter ATP-binding protein [Christensenellales bacterium]|jgi:ATP-binding cassette subfamily B protein